MATRSAAGTCKAKLDKPGMSVGVAREYMALLHRYHGTVVRLHVIAKRHFQEASTMARQAPEDQVPTDFLNKILRIFPNDSGPLQNVSTWTDLLRFFKRKEDMVRDRFQYLTDEADALLNALSKRATLADADSLQHYADALQQLLKAITDCRERTKDLLRANAKYQQELVPQMVFDEDVDDGDKRRRSRACYHVYSMTPLPSHLLPFCAQLTEECQRATTEECSASQINQDVESIVASHGLQWKESVTLVNPDEPKHTAVLEQAICARVAGPLSPRIEVSADEQPGPHDDSTELRATEARDDARRRSTGHSNSTGSGHAHIAEPGEPGWVYVIGIKEGSNGGRASALSKLTEAAAGALHHNCPDGGWRRLQGHVFAYGLLQSEDNIGVCAFALGHKLSERGVYPRIYRRDVFLGPSHALPRVLAVLLQRAVPRLTRTYEDALGWANHHPAICKEDLYFLKECSVRVVDGRVYSDMDIFESTTATLKQFDRTVGKVWRAWRAVHFDHDRNPEETIHSAPLQPRGPLLVSPGDDLLRSQGTRSPSCLRSATRSRSSTLMSRGLSPCLSLGSTASPGKHSEDAPTPDVPDKSVASHTPIMATPGSTRAIEEDGVGHDHGDQLRGRVSSSAKSSREGSSETSACSNSSASSSHLERGRGDEAPIVSSSGEVLAEEWVDRRGMLAVAKVLRHGRCVAFSTTYLGAKTGVSTREQLLDVAIQLLRLSVKGLVHGDVRNANVIMHGMRHAYLIDFETVHHEGAPFPANLDTELVERHPQLVGRCNADRPEPRFSQGAQTPGQRSQQAGQSSHMAPAASALCTYSLAHDWYALLMCFTMYASRDRVERFKRAKSVLKAYLGSVLQQHDKKSGRLESGEEFSAAEIRRVRHIRSEVNLAAWP